MTLPATPIAGSLVLIVEDETDLAEIIELYLRRENLRTERVTNGLRALEMIQHARPQLVLLDIQLPGMDGLEILRRIRATSNTPVIMMTARAEDLDKLLGLELGADDYVVKPFNPPELVARAKAVLRRSALTATKQDIFNIGPLELDTMRQIARVAGTRLELTITEFRLLEHLVRHNGRVFNRTELIEAAMPDSDALERVVDQHMKNLRRKLEAAGGGGMLETVRGSGYRLWGQ